jgi:tetratricopeptide (TPR) repeat protein
MDLLGAGMTTLADAPRPDLAALARRALEAGRLDEAAAAIDVLVRERPELAESWMLRGVLALQHGAAADAAAAFEQASRCGGDARKVCLGAGMAALGLGENERAWSLFDGVAREHQDDPEAMHWLLCAGTALGRWDVLAQRLDAFVARNPEQHAVRFALGAVCLRLGDRAGARAHCETLERAVPDFVGLDDLRAALAG